MNTLKSLANTTTKLCSSIIFFASLIACQGEIFAQTLDTKTLEPPLRAEQYISLHTPLEVSTGDKIEVAELFWYGCSHCFSMEPLLNEWKKNIPENVEFVKIPAIFSTQWEFHARAFYTFEGLNVLDQVNEAFFHQIHVLRKPINDLDALTEFLSKYDKSAKEVTAMFNSFAVDAKVRNAKIITAKSTANGVPAMLVDGKYQTSATLAGSVKSIFDVVDQLVVKAASER